MTKLKSDPDGPDVFQLERSLLADQLSLVPRLVGLGCVKNCHDLTLLKGLVRVLLRPEARRDTTQCGHALGSELGRQTQGEKIHAHLHQGIACARAPAANTVFGGAHYPLVYSLPIKLLIFYRRALQTRSDADPTDRRPWKTSP